MNIIVRPGTPADRENVCKVNCLAFGGDAEANLVNTLTDDGHAKISLVAERERDILGHILFTGLKTVPNLNGITAFSLAPMAVRPDCQRQGIGSMLVEAGLAACRSRHVGIVLVLGHPDYYRRFGFSSRLAESVDSPFGGGDAWMAVELIPGCMVGMKARVEYAAPFKALQ